MLCTPHMSQFHLRLVPAFGLTFAHAAIRDVSLNFVSETSTISILTKISSS